MCPMKWLSGYRLKECSWATSADIISEISDMDGRGSSHPGYTLGRGNGDFIVIDGQVHAASGFGYVELDNSQQELESTVQR